MTPQGADTYGNHRCKRKGTTDMSDLSTLERAILEALETSATFFAAALRQAESDEDRKHFKAELNAVTKATYHYIRGVRPEQLAGGTWLIPSGTRAGVVHRIADSTCSCEAGGKGDTCWHIAMVAGCESGADTQYLVEDIVEPVYTDADAERDLAECWL